MTRSLFFVLAFCSLMLAPSLSAAICPDTTNCTFTFNVTNGGTSGNFGTVNLATMGSDILVTVDLAAGLHLIQTGSHQSFDFNDDVPGTPTQGSFSDSQYSQATPPPFADDGFGTFLDAVASTAGPGAGTTGVNVLTFKVLGITDVNHLVGLSSGGVNAFFAADIFADASACGATGFGTSCTGLIGVTGPAVPEPSSYLAILLGGFGAIVFLTERRRRKAA